MNNHIMIDLETLGTTPCAAVISCGAVIFNREKVLQEKLWIFDLRRQLQGRRSVSADTLIWWQGQGHSAKSVFEKTTTEGIYLQDFAYQLKEFAAQESSLRVWSLGASFDIPIVEHILAQQGVKPPWSFTNHRCYRTAKSCMGVGRGMPFEGVKHDALDDARHQAKCLMAFFQKNPEADK